MPVSVAWGTKVINVPQSYLALVSGVTYSLDVDQLRLDLKGLEASAAGLPFPDTHNHNTEVVLSGVTYSRFFEVINGYTVEFEDGQYVVLATGANHNIADVKVINQVSLITQNSAGLVSTAANPTQQQIRDAMQLAPTGSAVADSVDIRLDNVFAAIFAKAWPGE